MANSTTNAPDAIPADVMALGYDALDCLFRWTRNMTQAQRDDAAAAISTVFLADRASRAPLAAPAAEGWRDMASAPKDGTVIDLWIESEHGPCREADAHWNAGANQWQLGTFHAGQFAVTPKIIAWMPLPPAPAPSGTAEVEPWTREDLAEALARLDGLILKDIRSTVGPADDANNWREYLGRADDLLADLSLCVSTAAHPPTVEVRELVVMIRKLVGELKSPFPAEAQAIYIVGLGPIAEAETLLAKIGGDHDK